MKRPRTRNAEDLLKPHQKAESMPVLDVPISESGEHIDAQFLRDARNILIRAVKPDEIEVNDPILFEVIDPQQVSYKELSEIDAGTDSPWILNINPTTFSDEYKKRPIGGHSVHTFDGERMYAVLDHLRRFSSENFPGMKSFLWHLANQSRVREYLKGKVQGHALIFNGITFRALGDWMTLCLYIDAEGGLVPGVIHLEENFYEATMTFAWFADPELVV